MEAQRLLALSREARWSFPSSFGNPGAPVERVAAEQESFTEAARFLVESGDEEAAVELAANVWRLWVMSGDVTGGREFLAGVLNSGERKPSRARALALYGDGLLALRQGAREESRERNEAALAAARAAGDQEALALAHLGLSRVAFEEVDFERAGELAAKARELAGPFDPALGQAPLHMHGQATRFAGDYDGAAALLAESLELNRRIDDQGMVGVELHNLGHVELHRGNVDAAERHFAECERLGSAEDPYSAAMAHLNRAGVAFARGDRNGASGFLARMQSVLDEAGIDPASDDQFEIDQLNRQLA